MSNNLEGLGKEGKGGAKHAARVRLFQIMCALEPERDVPLSQSEIEFRFEELFVAPESKAEIKISELDSDEDDRGRAFVPFEEFRLTCAQVVKIREALDEIDSIIERFSTGWKPSRMSLVDRTAIRIAVYEGFVARTVPVSVALSEAVLLCKEFSGPESGRFVNGVLARIARAPEQ